MDSENIVSILDVNIFGQYRKSNGKCLSVAYYVMEIAENGELFQFLQETPKFDEKVSRFYFSQLLDGY